MARVPDEDIERVKRETDLAALVRSRGIELKKHGSKDLVGRCPFHDDNESPNFIVSTGQGALSLHGLRCRRQRHPVRREVRRRELPPRLRAAWPTAEGRVRERAGERRPKAQEGTKCPSCPVRSTPTPTTATLLDQVSDYYHERLHAVESRARLPRLARPRRPRAGRALPRRLRRPDARPAPAGQEPP